MKYEIGKIGEAGKLYVEDDDILSIKTGKDGTHAVELLVENRRQYRTHPEFEWQGSLDEALRLRLLPRQALEIVEQEREQQRRFCTDCYDYGKSENPPNQCVRCQLLHAIRKSGQGDYRKVAPVSQSQNSWGINLMLVMLVLSWWWTLVQLAHANTMNDDMKHTIETLRSRAGCN